jgi:hypothetical protein
MDHPVDQRCDDHLRRTILAEEGKVLPLLRDIEEFVGEPHASRECKQQAQVVAVARAPPGGVRLAQRISYLRAPVDEILN